MYLWATQPDLPYLQILQIFHYDNKKQLILDTNE